ncbi:MAG: hypothetical protein WD604_02790, partial [Balneolaceae bacterium]
AAQNFFSPPPGTPGSPRSIVLSDILMKEGFAYCFVQKERSDNTLFMYEPDFSKSLQKIFLGK